MEKIDFNSWLEKIDEAETIETDTEEKLVSECDRQAFKQYTKWVKCAEAICKNFINPDYKKWVFDKDADEEQFVKSLIHYLFKAKSNRLEARRTSTPNVETNKYVEGANILNLALNHIPLEYLQKPLGDNRQRKKDYDLLMILFYNDLSICYAGLKNSSMSRGYAEESIKLIEEDEDYIKFREEIDRKRAMGNDKEKVSTLPFVSGESKKYDLYTFALFCRGVAEFRSFLKEEAEKTFMQIIRFAKEFECLKNSDYFSTLIHLSSLLIDLGRGKEAIQMLEGVSRIDKTDRRWAENLLEKASALIDQSCYAEARETLNELLDSEKSEKEERFAEPVLNGLIYYGRSYLEEARNILPRGKTEVDIEKNSEKPENIRSQNLKKAIKKLKVVCECSKNRDQKSLIQKAAKYLAEVYQEYKDEEKTLKYYSISISEGKVDDFESLLKNNGMDFVKHCEDIDILDNFSKQIFDFISAEFEKKKSRKEYDKNITNLCLGLLDKLKKECEEKGNLALSEQAERRKEEIELIQQGSEAGITPGTLKRKHLDKNYEILTGRGSEDKQQKGNSFLLDGHIKARLDSNEKTFDGALYGRTGKIINNSLVELIVLRRWNSFSPGLSRRDAISLGGGYLLRIWAPKFKGINDKDLRNKKQDEQESWFNMVIDPGYNFLLNFHSENFRIEDIDAIVVTHSHPDHCAELPGIMDLMRQINKRWICKKEEKNRKRLHLLLSEGAYKKFSSYIQDWKEQLKDVVLLRNKTKWPEENQEFEIEARRTAHADLGGVRAIGILVKIKNKDDILLGFTGDTPWRKYVRESFRNCDLLCLHMGGVKYEEIGYDKNGDKIKKQDELRKKIQKKYKEANHLLFYGSKDVIDSCKEHSALVIVGEFGEELKYGLRTDLVNKLGSLTGPLCIPADIGLYLIIIDKEHKKIRCGFCEGFVRPKEIEVFAYGIIDSLHYICSACNYTLRESQKRTIVEHQLTRH